MGDGVANDGVAHALDAGGDVTYLTGSKSAAWNQIGCAHVAHLHHMELCAGSHHQNVVAWADGALHDADVNDNALVAVIIRVKDQRLQRSIRVAARRRNIGDDAFEHVLNV